MVFNKIKPTITEPNVFARFLQSHLPNTTSGNNECSNSGQLIPKFFPKCETNSIIVKPSYIKPDFSTIKFRVEADFYILEY